MNDEGNVSVEPMVDSLSDIEKQTRNWGLLLHLSMLLGAGALPVLGYVAPIVIWQIKKDEFPGIDQHGKNAVNWMISQLIYLVVSGVLVIFLIGFLFLAVLAVVGIAFPIVAAVKANQGETWKYPMSITFIK